MYLIYFKNHPISLLLIDFIHIIQSMRSIKIKFGTDTY